jgi:4-amino-4-deoxy-L-arabinose transferase-like glycosyltransferase
MTTAVDRVSSSNSSDSIADPTDEGSANPVDAPGRRDGPLRRLSSNRMVWIMGIVVVAAAARLVALRSAYDVFIDEVTYTTISRNLAHGHGLVLYGQPFDLHPPAAFALYAGVIRVFGLHGSVEATLFALRNVPVVLGTVTCVLTFLIVERAGGRWTALCAGLLVALDPMVISYDSRVMLEAPAQCAVAAMVLCLVHASGASRGTSSVSVKIRETIPYGIDPSATGRPIRWRWVLPAGLFGAIVLCTKETFGLVVGLTLVVLVITGWVVPRRQAAVVLALTVLGYAVSVVAVGLTSGFDVWWHATAGGALRLIGTKQITGFNSPTVHVSFISRVLANGPLLAGTYLVLGAGVLAGVGLLWRLEPWSPGRYPRRTADRVGVLIGVWTLAAAAYLVYATVFGTIEEQMYYILFLPCVMSLCLWFDGTLGSSSPLRGRWRNAAVILVVVALVFDLTAWTVVHARSDDETRRMLTWEATHVPPSAVVSSTDGTTQFLLPNGIIGQWNTIAELRAHHVDYVILATSLVEQGYGVASPAFAQEVEQTGRLVFAADGVSDGSLQVYDVRGITGGSATSAVPASPGPAGGSLTGATSPGGGA